MRSTRPNPTQTRRLDAVTLRRELRLMLPGGVALDQEDLRACLDPSNQSAHYNVLRLKLLRRAIATAQSDDLLSPAQFAALLAYHGGDGPRPPWLRFVSPAGHHGRHFLAADDVDAPKAAAPGPVEDPGEPGRFVQPKGEYAIPGYPR